MRKEFLALAAGAALLMAACGEAEKADVSEAPTAEPTAAEPAPVLANGMTAVDTIAMRQAKFKELGKSSKTIGDQLKGGGDVEAIKAAAAVMSAHAADMGNWFPEGSGPEAGIETEALAKIWDDADGYAAVVAKFQAATSDLSAAAETGDMKAIMAAFRTTGVEGCKACHDAYRLDD